MCKSCEVGFGRFGLDCDDGLNPDAFPAFFGTQLQVPIAASPADVISRATVRMPGGAELLTGGIPDQSFVATVRQRFTNNATPPRD